MRNFKTEQPELICNKMLKGISGEFPVSAEQRAIFVERFRVLAEIMLPHIPRGSASVGAVICKCALKYGLLKAIAFAESVKQGTFTGPNDPAKLLWIYLTKNAGAGKEKGTEIYCKTVTAARAWCEEKTLARSLHPAAKDIFEWDEQYRYPAFGSDCIVENQNSSQVLDNNISNDSPTQS